MLLGAAQVLIGFMLILGCLTRLANWGAVLLTLLYTLLGFTRYAPYLMGFGFIALALGSGTPISFIDNLMKKSAEEKMPLQLAVGPAVCLSLLGMYGFATATVLGVVPNGYQSAVGATVFWTLSINVCLLSLGSFLPVMATSASRIGDAFTTALRFRAAYAKF